MANVKLRTSDKELFHVNRDIAFMSGTIKNLFEDMDSEDVEMPLPNVTADIMKKVLEFCEHYKDLPVPMEKDNDTSKKKEIVIEGWDADYVKVELPFLCNLILAANYLDIPPLLDLTCKTVALMIKGKTSEEIKKIFNLPDPEPVEQPETSKQTYV